MNINFDFKSLLSLETTYGKKLVTAVYYIMSVTIAVNAVVSFIAGIANIAGGMVLTGIGQIIFCIPLAIVYFVLLRLGCEVVNAILEHCGKE